MLPEIPVCISLHVSIIHSVLLLPQSRETWLPAVPTWRILQLSYQRGTASVP